MAASRPPTGKACQKYYKETRAMMILQEKTTKGVEREMFKKITTVTALSAALIFTGVSSASAAENPETNIKTSYNVYYSVNGGELNSLSGEKAKGLFDKVWNNFSSNWDSNTVQAEPKQNTNKEEVNKQESKEEAKQEQPAKEKQPEKQAEQPAKEQQPEQPVKEEQPEKEKQPEQPAEQKEQEQAQEQPKEQPEAPAPQQPAQQQQEQQNQEQSQQLNEFEQQVVELTNSEREKHGLSPLKVDEELSKVAREKSRDMAANNYFAHNSPTYGSPFDMMQSYGVDYSTAGENIAKGQTTPEQVVNGWMNSEGHRANILNANFTHIGVGYVEDGNHWTQQFIGK